MEAQLTIRLPEDLKRALDETSRRMRRKNSEVVRMALRTFIESSNAPAGRPTEKARRLLGSLESGVPDLAHRHREYVIESLKHGR